MAGNCRGLIWKRFGTACQRINTGFDRRAAICRIKNALLHRGISYLDDAGDEAVSGRSDYERGIMLNRQALDENMHPCEIQFKRLKSMEVIGKSDDRC